MFDDAAGCGKDPDGRGWQLIDPRPIQQANPHTFFVPSDAEKAALVPGDLIKLMFDPGDADGAIERMWAIYRGRDQSGCYGELDNQPLGIDGLNVGDHLSFEDHHIIGVWESKIDTVDHEDRMFARCHVDPRILDDGAPIARMIRRRPRLRWWPWRDRRWPDTGWYIYAGDGPRPGRRKMQYVAIGVVLNKDDSILPHLSEPLGADMVRDGNTFRRA